MRSWYKYSLDPSLQGQVHLPIDRYADDHARTMDRFEVDGAYQDKGTFFHRYLTGYQFSRLEYYNDFLRRHLKRGEEILSIASGRCANELGLMEDGYSITCSDLKEWEIHERTRRLFPGFEFMRLDVLEGPAYKRYDAVVCLSLIYLFDESQLRLFFRNVSDSLRLDGQLLLDSAGSPDNVLSTLIHDLWLKYEVVSLRLVKGLLRRRLDGFVTKHHGYRRTDREIIESARQAGLELRCQKHYAFTTEFRRSRILGPLIAPGSVAEGLCRSVGRAVPYIRMFKFKKVA